MGIDLLRVLVVDDDEEQLELMRRSLTSQQFEVRTSSTPIGVSNIVRDFVPDVILIDLNQPALSGDRLIKLVRQNTCSNARLVLYSSADVDKLRRLAAEVLADGWIQKGLPPSELAMKLRSLCWS